MIESHQAIIEHTRNWVEKMVIGLNLCPFARRPFEGGQVRYVVSETQDTQQLLKELEQELRLLQQSDPKEIETTLLIHPRVLNDFYDYNNFLDEVDWLIKHLQMQGEFQVASLHPDYQFAGTQSTDVENYTNRAPYPSLHLLREELLEQAIAAHPDPDAIPNTNIRTMEKLGEEKVKELQEQCCHHHKPKS